MSGSLEDLDTSDSPAEYVEKLRAENRALRRELVGARAELDEAMLTIARMVVERKQYADAIVKRIADPDFGLDLEAAQSLTWDD